MGWPVCVFPDNAMAAVPVLSCTDCVFWCGQCKEPTTKGKASINRLASSMACERFFKREHTKSPVLTQNIPEGGKV